MVQKIEKLSAKERLISSKHNRKMDEIRESRLVKNSIGLTPLARKDCNPLFPRKIVIEIAAAIMINAHDATKILPRISSISYDLFL